MQEGSSCCHACYVYVEPCTFRQLLSRKRKEQVEMSAALQFTVRQCFEQAASIQPTWTGHLSVLMTITTVCTGLSRHQTKTSTYYLVDHHSAHSVLISSRNEFNLYQQHQGTQKYRPCDTSASSSVWSPHCQSTVKT